MKRFFSLLTAALMSICLASAADNNTKNEARNSNPENICGKYYIEDEDGTSYARIFKHSDGTYRCQQVDGKPEYDKNGKLKLDEYNQDPELRKLGIHEMVIIFGLKYDAKKKIWTDGKIHHPFKKLMKANCDAYFVGDGNTLCIFGNVAGMGAKRYWKKIE